MKHLLAAAYRQAIHSHDPSSQNGAVLVRDGVIVSRGFNHIPYKEGDELEALLKDREAKYAHVVHAEVDSIADAAWRGSRTHNLTMVCPWAACSRCAGTILQAGISRLVVHKQRMDLTHEPWAGEVASALRWLEESGVEIVQYNGPVDAPEILVAGAMWSPRGN